MQAPKDMDMQSRFKSPAYFYIGLLGLCFFYLTSVLYFNYYTMFSADEFWFTHNIYQYSKAVPYRDFAPYKTVLGYYLLLPILLTTSDAIGALAILKNSIALLNTVVMLFAALWLRRFVSPKAILSSLLLLISTETVLAYSTNVRVDLLAYWFCLFSLCLLLENRYLLAGLLLGFGFITSQKVLWCALASNCALFAYWLLFIRDKKFLYACLRFNGASILVIALYLLFWSRYASLTSLINSLFLEASTMYHLDWYSAARKLFWHDIICYNPLFYLLLPATFFSLLISSSHDLRYKQRLFVIIYSCTILICLIPYRQIFPYYMQITYGPLLITYAFAFSWFYQLHHIGQVQIKSLGLLRLFTVMYGFGIIFVIYLLALPFAYFLMCLLPIFLYCYGCNLAQQGQNHRLWLQLLLITVIFVGGIYPGILNLVKTINLNGDYQRAHLAIVNALLKEGGDYLAGVELIYNKNQPIPGMRHLNGPAIDFLAHPRPALQAAMLPALDLDPHANLNNVLSALKQSSVKFYVNNYRIFNLPSVLKNFLNQEYEHYWGSIYIYAPAIPAGEQLIRPKFPGNYLIETSNQDDILLNGITYHNNTVVYLKYPIYSSIAKHPYRLRLMPEQLNSFWQADFANDQWEKIIF